MSHMKKRDLLFKISRSNFYTGTPILLILFQPYEEGGNCKQGITIILLITKKYRFL